MKSLILSSFLVIGISGCALANTSHTSIAHPRCGIALQADLPIPDPGSSKKPEFAADLPIPDPRSSKKPEFAADLPIPDPNSSKKPEFAADLPIPDPNSSKKPELSS